jgi:hypothetical protein
MHWYLFVIPLVTRRRQKYKSVLAKLLLRLRIIRRSDGFCRPDYCDVVLYIGVLPFNIA